MSSGESTIHVEQLQKQNQTNKQKATTENPMTTKTNKKQTHTKTKDFTK